MSAFIDRLGGLRAGLVVLLVSAVLGGVAAVSTASETEAAWSDRTYVSASVTAGTWVTTPAAGSTCVAINGGGNPVGTCTVKSIRYEEWGTAGNHTRNYYMTFTLSDPSPTKSIRVDVDLSSVTGTTTGTGSWNWATAATLTSGQFTPSSTCVTLPRLQGATISNWDWSTNPTVFFSATDNRSGTPVASQSCR